MADLSSPAIDRTRKRDSLMAKMLYTTTGHWSDHGALARALFARPDTEGCRRVNHVLISAASLTTGPCKYGEQTCGQQSGKAQVLPRAVDCYARKMSSLFSTLWRHCSKETKPRENFFSDIVAELFKAHPELLSRWLQSVGVTVA
jgi:hypothetical protein